MNKIRCMKELSIFQSLDFLEKEKIGALACKKTYQKNEHVFYEGDLADTIYLVKSGRIRLYKTSYSGKEITLDILKADDLFGENTFFEDTVHSMNAQALDNTFICSCSREQLPLLLSNPATAMKIIQELSTKIQDYSEQIARIAFNDVKSRTSEVLLRLANDYGETMDNGTVLDIKLTHQDLACLVNASRVMVSNIMSGFKQQGLIAHDGRRIILLNLEELDREKVRS